MTGKVKKEKDSVAKKQKLSLKRKSKPKGWIKPARTKWQVRTSK